MMDTLHPLFGYVVHILFMVALFFLVGIMSGAFPSFSKLPDYIQFWIILIIPMALKNFQWVTLISQSHYTLPSTVSQVIAILLCLSCYLVCMMIMPAMLRTCALVWTAAQGQQRDEDQLPGWLRMVLAGVTFVVTDRITSYYMDPSFISEFLSSSLRFSTHVIASLFSLAGYLVYMACMMALSFLVGEAMSDASLDKKLPDYMFLWIVLMLPFTLKNFLWLVMISESHYTLPSSVSQVIAILFCLASYLMFMMIVAVVLNTWPLIDNALRQHLSEESADFISMTMIGVRFMAMDMFMSYSNMVMNPVFISEFLHIMAPLSFLIDYLIYLIYIVCMVAFSCLVLVIAHAAIQNTRIWCPELIHTSIVALTLLLLNIIWGSPFEKPSTVSYMKPALVGISGYIIYIVSSMALTYNLFGALLLLKTFIISLTFVMLDMFVKPSSVSDIIPSLVGLTGMISMALLGIFFLVSLSFVVFMFLHTWAVKLLPSARRDSPVGTFVIIVGLTFAVMRTMLDIPVEEPSIFANMKTGLLDLTNTVNEYHSAYVVIRNLTILAVPLLSMESRRIVSMYQLCTMAAFIVALGLVLTMPPGPDMPTESPASSLVTDEFVQQTITSFVSSQIKAMDGEIEQLNDS